MAVYGKKIYLGFGESIGDNESDTIKRQFEEYAQETNLPLGVERRVGRSVFYRVQEAEFPHSADGLKKAIEEIAGGNRRVHQPNPSLLAYTVYAL